MYHKNHYNMDLEKIINISGKPGLYKVISQTKNVLILELLIDKKRIAINTCPSDVMLNEIGIYTYNETKPLSEVFELIAKKENYNTSINHKSSKNELTLYFREILDNYDEERVYLSDIKKSAV